MQVGPIMITLEALQGDISVTDAIAKLDLPGIIQANGSNGEITTNAFIRYLTEQMQYTFESARSVIYALVDLGRVVLTDRYTLRYAG
jgi:hypothetical protein